MESASPHLGHLFLDCMRQRPDVICQIDAATGKEETNASVLSRSVQLARCLRNFGLCPGDVLSLGGRNHLDLHIPFYAALLTGLPISGVDPYFKYDEIKSLLNITRPKIAFCQQDAYDYYMKALNDLELDTKVVLFDGVENSLQEFIRAYDSEEPAEDFKPAKFDVDKIYAFLVSTSGTTGGLKVAAFKHQSFIEKIKLLQRFQTDHKNNKIVLYLSPVQWISGIMYALAMPACKQTKLQTSKPDDEDHIIEMINKYKPVSSMMAPSLVSSLVHRKDEVDLSCFDVVVILGSKINIDTLTDFKKQLREGAQALEGYGLTETIGPVLIPIPGTPIGSCGILMPLYETKLVDPDSGVVITEANVTGELWTKGAGFTEYYKDPESTAKAFSKDGFFRTGDLWYRDEKNFYFFVDRIKSLIKYRNSQIVPTELEAVVRQHPAVREVCVLGLPHPVDGQRPVACVVREGIVTEQELKDLVASKLSKNKQLHKVVFLEQLPMTSTGKTALSKLRELVSK